MNQIDKEELQSRVIDFLRFPLMIGVVIIHCRFTTRLYPQLIDYVRNGGWYDYVSYLFSKAIFGFCVPVFFMISGYLFFKTGDFNFQSYRVKLKKRFLTILIPFMLWNFIYLLLEAVFGYNIFRNESEDVIGYVPWLNANTGVFLKDAKCCFFGLFVNFNGGGSPINVPFWYLRDLITMFVFSPIIYWFIKYFKRFGMIILVVAWLVTGKYSAFLVTYLRPPVLFFIMGAYFALNEKNIVAEFMKVGNWVFYVYAIIVIVDLFSKQMLFNCYIHRLAILVGVIAVFKIGAFLVKKKKTENRLVHEIKNTYFFIFAFHWILLYWLAFPLSKLTSSGSDLSLLIIYFVQIIFGCLISILLGVGLNRLCPRIMKVLNGR